MQTWCGCPPSWRPRRRWQNLNSAPWVGWPLWLTEEPETKKEKKSKKKKKHLKENENVAEVKIEKNLSLSKNGKKKKIKPDISSVKSFNGASLDKIKGYGY